MVKAWANHPWPMTSAEAQELYESLGYRAHAPKPELFISDFSQIEIDSYVTTHNDRVGRRTHFSVPPYAIVTPQNDTISRTFNDYCAAIEDKLDFYIARKIGTQIRWTLRNSVGYSFSEIIEEYLKFIGHRV